MAMKLSDLSLAQLREAPWNPNHMDAAMLSRLKESLKRYGLVENLVVRPLDGDNYEVLSGNQRLQALRDLDHGSAPCLVIDLDNAQARLLAQALNRIQGEDDLGLKAELVREVLAATGKEGILDLLPETDESLEALASLGLEDMEAHLDAWEQAQGARLKHLTFQLTAGQLEMVEESLGMFVEEGKTMKDENPNVRGNTLFLLCQRFLELNDGGGGRR